MGIKLRPYQEQAVKNVKRQLQEHQSTLVVLPTGCGKTMVFATLAAQWEGRVLILAHTDELIRQAADKVEMVMGVRPSIEKAEQYSDEEAWFGKPKVVVASVQTLSKARRLQRFKPEEFGLLVIDEAHHAISPSYRTVVDHFLANPGCRLLGVTATPKRMDGLAMGQVFRSTAMEYEILDAVNDGWLVMPKQRRIVVAGLDFSKVRTTAGDLNEGDLDAILSEEEALHLQAAPLAEIIGNLPTLVFCTSVNHARGINELLNERYLQGRSAYLSGKDTPEHREATVARFRSGELQILCNCGLFLEGFDAPNVACVAMLRPTKSLGLYTQVVGRGTRAFPSNLVDRFATPEERIAAIAASEKPTCLIADLVGNCGRHRLAGLDDVLGGRYSQAVKDYARKNLEEEGTAVAPTEALARAELELALEEEQARLIRERNRRRAVVAQATYQSQEVNPFTGDPGALEVVNQNPDKPSPKQIRFLIHLGVEPWRANKMSRREASREIEWLTGE